jgi:outer membrane protein assembly factor BamD (BamD/ComL family)
MLLKILKLIFSFLLLVLCAEVGITPLAYAQGYEKASAPAADIYNKALRLYEAHRWDAAKEYLHRYLAEYSETPLYITCLYYLGYCYQQLKDTEEAILIYHKVIDQAKGEEAFWAEMAQARILEIAP